MYIQQKELFWGLNQHVVNRVMSIAERRSFSPGEVVYRTGDPAGTLYILAQGEVKIAMCEDRGNVYTGNKVGELFGWGCLIERDTYGATATCSTPAVILAIDRGRLLKLFDDDMQSGYLFFKHLSCALGCRLSRMCREVPQHC
jgi:CRP-like cAMP-binding protein